MRKTKEAFYWVVGVLQANKVPFQISGGLAARVYGSKRRLADIDIEIPEKYFKRIASDIRKHVLYGLKHFRDHEFDVWIVTLRYKGQDIDITASDSVKVFDKNHKKWISGTTDLSETTWKEVFGIKVPLMRKAELVRYKKMLGRRVDKADVKAMTNPLK